MEKIHIERNTVQETLIIPLYARKLCTEKYPNLFKDERAVELIGRLDYDFSQINADSFSVKFGALETAMRQYDMAAEVREYLKTNPKAAVVNIGCGLDQTGENCDNGQCKIYNIDLPDVIAVRNQLLPPAERVTNIAADINNFSWFEKIDNSHGAVFFAAGVFYYFKREQVITLINAMAQKFKGGKLVFDAANKRAVKIMVKEIIKKSGMDVDAFTYIDNLDKDLASHLKNAKVTSRGYMLGYNNLKDKSVRKTYRLLAKVADKFMKMKIVRADFI